ncbi:hypothetical protein C8Q76DRAFT_800955 [Earliella scabrosa]|nr:hypothetical protein C8Q76DRAFT_800955 [Earliella scabrosa]
MTPLFDAHADQMKFSTAARGVDRNIDNQRGQYDAEEKGLLPVGSTDCDKAPCNTNALSEPHVHETMVMDNPTEAILLNRIVRDAVRDHDEEGYEGDTESDDGNNKEDRNTAKLMKLRLPRHRTWSPRPSPLSQQHTSSRIASFAERPPRTFVARRTSKPDFPTQKRLRIKLLRAQLSTKLRADHQT